MIKLASALNLRTYAKNYLSLIQYYKNFDLIRRLILTNTDVLSFTKLSFERNLKVVLKSSSQ